MDYINVGEQRGSCNISPNSFRFVCGYYVLSELEHFTENIKKIIVCSLDLQSEIWKTFLLRYVLYHLRDQDTPRKRKIKYNVHICYYHRDQPSFG